jgi:hypothetical protein
LDECETFGIKDPPIDVNHHPVPCWIVIVGILEKTISFYMPKHLVQWSTTNNEGNPTKSIDVNDLIRRVKKKEVRQQEVIAQ